ncbi:DEP domain-containing protein 7 isoform X1 [Gadus morhua]|uniref:DEP domain-containing protein 7 n=1 Tax=Gadus morhua TaxID=8049 RepID=A0A8C4Z0A5_GADMO|nr:DEP domain-containing protein 7-like isoform X1 [Gadus morhua]
MATIKERLAALNLAEKLYVRPPAQGGICRNYQSLSSWSGLIAHLKASVKVKRRRVYIKSHGDCFLGSDAVDVVADHLSHIKGLEGATVSREKVVVVCQALLDCHVFEAVGTKVFGKDKNLDRFNDCSNALYKFLLHTPSVDELDRGVLSHGVQKYFCTDAFDGQESLKLPGDTKPPETLPDANRFQAVIETDKLSLSPSRLQTDTVLPQTLVNEVWQEQTTVRLLKLVDLPLLDGVLQCSLNQDSHFTATRPLAHCNPDLIYSNQNLDRQILQAFKEFNEDEWLCAALGCLDLLPDKAVMELGRAIPNYFRQEEDSQDYMVVDRIAPEEGGLSQCQLLVYGILVKHYSLTDMLPLLPGNLTDVYAAIIDLLVNAKLDKALEALQLCLKLLPTSCREELRRLLTFMSLAADPQGIRLDKEMENRLAVRRSFSRALLHSKTLSKEQEELMVAFMLSNTQDIFRIPGALHKAVSDKLSSLVHRNHPDVTGSTFCQQDFRDSAHVRDVTQGELRALLSNIHLDPKISDRKKRRLLRQFYQAHPEVFDQYFGDSALSML